jgi:hypothetical protein
MNPMVFTILAWEKEMEMQWQSHKIRLRDPGLFMPENRKSRRASRRPFFARILGLGPQPPCECS